MAIDAEVFLYDSPTEADRGDFFLLQLEPETTQVVQITGADEESFFVQALKARGEFGAEWSGLRCRLLREDKRILGRLDYYGLQRAASGFGHPAPPVLGFPEKLRKESPEAAAAWSRAIDELVAEERKRLQSGEWPDAATAQAEERAAALQVEELAKRLRTRLPIFGLEHEIASQVVALREDMREKIEAVRSAMQDDCATAIVEEGQRVTEHLSLALDKLAADLKSDLASPMAHVTRPTSPARAEFLAAFRKLQERAASSGAQTFEIVEEDDDPADSWDAEDIAFRINGAIAGRAPDEGLYPAIARAVAAELAAMEDRLREELAPAEDVEYSGAMVFPNGEWIVPEPDRQTRIKGVATGGPSAGEAGKSFVLPLRPVAAGHGKAGDAFATIEDARGSVVAGVYGPHGDDRAAVIASAVNNRAAGAAASPRLHKRIMEAIRNELRRQQEDTGTLGWMMWEERDDGGVVAKLDGDINCNALADALAKAILGGWP